SSLKTTARLTGLFYLGLAITGMLGFIMIRPALYDPADAAQTAANLLAQPGLARIGIALELGIVLTQALAAVWFYRLFRAVDSFAAGAIAAFGMVNAVAILFSAAALTVALQVALDPALAPGGDAAATAQLMYALSSGAWGGGALFFGLWLIPMGYAVLASGWMPRLLGQILVVGGVGYLLSAFAKVLLVGAPTWLAAALTVPASVGEFWMVGYLLFMGVRASARETAVTAAT
ncbi:DUF4386 domain-containing protein, partial [Devosia sp.]|uniref:DUF4386 domain-containing protein n=1 Tax=Devosia sp. TaxID=1871048 RepID=UPI003A8ED791